jgi:predicted CXXCH cytochrome family protein
LRNVSLRLLLPSLLLLAAFAPSLLEDTAPLEREGDFDRSMQICADCHDGEAELILAGVHADVPRRKAPLPQARDACESCHGPAFPHADTQDPGEITHPAKLSPAAQRKLCERCHAQELASHGGPLEALLRAGKKCTDCHRIHERKTQRPGALEPRRFVSLHELRKAARPVGSDTCLSCHADHAKTTGLHGAFLKRSEGGAPRQGEEAARRQGEVSGQAESQRMPRRTEACESCHGPGSLHVATFGIAGTITSPEHAQDGDASCLRCHDAQRADFARKHAHPHAAPSDLRCASCHREHVARLPAFQRVQQTDANCTRCHEAQRGPFRYVHEADPRKGCLACHEPHGSAHAHLLRAEPRALCLSCHQELPGDHDQSAGSKYRSCLDCHGQIHGSHKDRYFSK